MKISFDKAGNPEQPTFILSTRNGTKICLLNAENVVIKDKDFTEVTFKVRKFVNGIENEFWGDIVDFKLVWMVEEKIWFEIKIDKEQSNEIVKTIYCTKLGYAELSQINLYNIEINTENDIARDDYVPIVIYDEDNEKASLLDILLQKAPHYRITHVDKTIKKIQRTFQFDSVSICDAFNTIEQEINCLIILDSNSDEHGNIQRTISVYDLERTCNNCGYRGEFDGVCPECGSDDIIEGYGEDTNIFITADELADTIEFSTDIDSVKNCFKLEAGDDLMTAAIKSCNPNGSDYIWYISEDLKRDMSDELRKRLNQYDKDYLYYNTAYTVKFDQTIVNNYNSLINKYKVYNDSLSTVENNTTGYINLSKYYYDTIDFLLYLQSGLMPSVEIDRANATEQIKKLTEDNLSPVSVANVDVLSSASADSAVLSMAKVYIDGNYKVKINNSNYSNRIWQGSFIVTNYSDDEDTATTNMITININGDYENFVKQKIDKMLDDNTSDKSVTALFKMDYIDFCMELKKYCLSRLKSFYDACQSCMDILIEQGAGDKQKWVNSTPNVYEDLYYPFYRKLLAISSEISVRESEINIIKGTFDSDNELITEGMQTLIESEIDRVQSLLNFQGYLGNILWYEFCSYRREDKYTNNNYISDGLTTAEIFDKANEFIQVAKKEIYKSAELQHSISTTFKNLLLNKKFEKLRDNFKLYNWLRVEIDDEVYRLRLINYEIDYDNLDEIIVEFSDVLKTVDGMSDKKSLFDKLQSMATTYDSVKRQAKQGESGKKQITNLIEEGLNATNTKIVSNAKNQTMVFDNHGLLCRQYEEVTEDYDDCQLKLINNGIYITEDGWQTISAALGKYYFQNPDTGEMEMSYGLLAEKIVGELIVGNSLKIKTSNGSFSIDENGVTMSMSSVTGLNDKVTEINNKIDSVDDKIKNSVTNVDVQYYLSDSNSELTNGEWVTECPTEGLDGKYIWTKTVTTMSDGSTSSTTPYCISNGDGVSSYTYIRYSEYANGNPMTEQPNDNTKYMGVCVTESSVVPQSYASYKWTKIKGEDAITLSISSSTGNMFINGEIGATLTATAYKGGIDVSTDYPNTAYSWTKVDKDGNIDEEWTDNHKEYGRVVEISNVDIYQRSQFSCELTL